MTEILQGLVPFAASIGFILGMILIMRIFWWIIEKLD